MQYTISHPVYGQAMQTAEPGVFLGNDDVTYVAALWGPMRVFAVVPAREVTVEQTIEIIVVIEGGDEQDWKQCEYITSTGQCELVAGHPAGMPWFPGESGHLGPKEVRNG